MRCVSVATTTCSRGNYSRPAAQHSRQPGLVSYAQLKSGKIYVSREVPTALSSYPKAREIAGILKQWIEKGEFCLTEPVKLLPSCKDGITARTLEIKGT